MFVVFPDDNNDEYDSPQIYEKGELRPLIPDTSASDPECTEDTPSDEQRQGTSPIKTSDHVFQSGLWGQVVRDQRLVSPVSQLIGPNVEFHHTNARKWMPSEQSHRELHQDRVFYPHESTNFVNARIHLDDFPDEEGTMRFIPGSHKDGNLGHIEGENGLPQLPAEDYEFKDSVKMSAEAGDMILMHINVVHSSEIDRATASNIVWIGYNDPSNQQLSRQAADREGFIVAGHRPK